MTLDDVLFPPLEPFRTGLLPLAGRHTLAWEESGTPNGMPLLFLHGGPGAGVRTLNRRYYDPAHWRIVMFDQRGCGRSTPHADLSDNDTPRLIGDIERLRRHLGIARWLVCGGSWGSFLGLAYAEAHPERCLGLLLRGIFLGRPEEIDWWFNGSRAIHPDRWQAFRDLLPEHERSDLLGGYYRRLIDPNPAVHHPAAQALRTYSAWTAPFRPTAEQVAAALQPRAALALARIFTHYCINRFFLPPGSLLAGTGRIRRLPGIIVQGRYDTVTPMATSWDLHRAWPEAEYVVVNDANHAIEEPDMAAALVAAAERLKGRM